MLYEVEMWAGIKRHETRIGDEDAKVDVQVMRNDKIRNERIRETTRVTQV